METKYKIVGIIVFLAVLFGLGALAHTSSKPNDVHITDFNYYYSDPHTGHNWTYTLPFNANVSEGSTSNSSQPFTDNLTCSMTFTQAYAITPGFTYQIEGLPKTFNPGQSEDFNVSMTFPSYQYSGAVDIKAFVTYEGNCYS